MDCPADQIMNDDKYLIKKNLILDLLNDIVTEKNKQKKQMYKFRKINNFLKTSTHFCNAVSVSSLISSFLSNLIGIIIGSTCATFSTLSSVINDSGNFQTKFLTSRTTYNQLSNLERETRSQLIKNNLTTSQLDDMLCELNHKISLINDTILN